MDDFRLIKEVLDGGMGWHPQLPDALKAWHRQTEIEYQKRMRESSVSDSQMRARHFGVEKMRVESLVMERARCS